MTAHDPIPERPKHSRAVRGRSDSGHGKSRFAPRDKRAVLFTASFLFDLIAIYVGYVCALQVRDARWLEAGGQSLFGLAVPIFIAFAIANKTQSSQTLDNPLLGARRALTAWAATAVTIILLTFLLQYEELSRLGFAVAFGVSAILMVLLKLLGAKIRQSVVGPSSIATALLVDGGHAEPGEGHDVVDVGKLGIWPDPNRPDYLDELAKLVARYDRLVIACSDDRRIAWSTFLRGLDIGGEILLDRSTLLGAVAIGEYGRSDTIVISLGPLDFSGRVQKRAFDFIVSIVALVILSPILIATALAISIDSRGNPLFRQLRIGQSNKQFKMFKFRSMRIESTDLDGNISTQREDKRITRVGRFIRRTSIDELPQLLNVIRGEMSLVGPRPHALGSTAGDRLFWEASKNYWLRHSLKPGMTGLAQIRGFRGATDNLEDLEQRVRCDLEYLANRTLWLDCKILAQTLGVVLHDKAY